ncbi:metallophosphoesterase [Pontibacter actiniarum]|uniref:Metallophosphatase n=1 Tax=Pontibacter actiniarum TaxID=323450 RepID=A0A1X9YRN3_9BACT|nr:metallophosphoesterase [Pontibacter actiniarum]ARS35546.1 metallophosphatase [Pontibacter actiniarum]
MLFQIIGFLIFSLLLLGLDLYLYQAILAMRWFSGGSKKKHFTCTWWGYAAVTILLAVFINRQFNVSEPVREMFIANLFIALTTKITFLAFVLLDDVRRGSVWLKRKLAPVKQQQIKPANPVENKITRSEFLLKTGALVAAVPLVSMSRGVLSGAYDYQVKHQVLYLPNLPKAFDGIRLGQLSDIHSGSFYNQRAVLGGVEMLLQEKPDFIFFTGDLVNDRASEMRDYQDIFSKVKAPLGVFSVLGNHDYGDYKLWESAAAKAKNLAAIKTTHKNMGWDLLLNEHRSLKVDKEELAIIGIENWGTGMATQYGRMDMAVKGTKDAPVKLLLSHDPSHWRAEVLPKYPQIDATFSGHTHGMQLGVQTDHFQWSPIQYRYSEWAGLYQEQQQQLYVNVGYGFLEYPGRVGILPEITVFELRCT